MLINSQTSKVTPPRIHSLNENVLEFAEAILQIDLGGCHTLFKPKLFCITSNSISIRIATRQKKRGLIVKRRIFFSNLGFLTAEASMFIFFKVWFAQVVSLTIFLLSARTRTIIRANSGTQFLICV